METHEHRMRRAIALATENVRTLRGAPFDDARLYRSTGSSPSPAQQEQRMARKRCSLLIHYA